MKFVTVSLNLDDQGVLEIQDYAMVLVDGQRLFCCKNLNPLISVLAFRNMSLRYRGVLSKNLNNSQLLLYKFPHITEFRRLG